MPERWVPRENSTMDGWKSCIWHKCHRSLFQWPSPFFSLNGRDTPKNIRTFTISNSEMHLLMLFSLFHEKICPTLFLTSFCPRQVPTDYFIILLNKNDAYIFLQIIACVFCMSKHCAKKCYLHYFSYNSPPPCNIFISMLQVRQLRFKWVKKVAQSHKWRSDRAQLSLASVFS